MAGNIPISNFVSLTSAKTPTDHSLCLRKTKIRKLKRLQRGLLPETSSLMTAITTEDDIPIDPSLEKMSHSLHPKCLRCRKCPLCMISSRGHNSFEARTLRMIRENCLTIDIDPATGVKSITVKYLFDPDKIGLVAQGYNQALTRLGSLANKLCKAGPVEQELTDLLNLGVSKGFWAEVSKKDLETTVASTTYLAYNYASKRDEASTTKSRLVMDPAAKGG